MGKITVSIESSFEEMLLGIYYTECVAEDINSGDIEEGSMLSLGFILFSINIFIKR